MNRIDLALVDRASAARDRIEALCADLPDLRVRIERHDSIRQGLTAIRERNFDAALVGPELEDGSGLEFGRKAGGSQCRTPLILLRDGEEISRLAITDAGFADHLDQDAASPELLARSIRHAKEVHDLRQRLVDAVGRSQRTVEAQSEFIGRLGHDLRTPLNGVAGFAALIRDQSVGPESADRYAEYAGFILDCAQQCFEMIEGLLEIHSLEHGPLRSAPRATDIAPEIGRAVMPLEVAAKKRGVTLNVVLPERPAEVQIADSDIRRITANLVENAIRYARAGGHVDVWLDRAEGEVALRVRDDGDGVAPDQVEQLMRPLVRGENRLPSHKGLGLGLATVKALTESHGGWLRIDTAQGEGFTATVMLPSADASRAAPTRLVRITS